MPPSIRQQRQALRRQRQQQRRAQRQGARRRRGVSPHLGRRVRSSDLYSLDERQRHMAQAILSRRHQAQQLQEQSPKDIDETTPAEPNQE